MPLTGFLVMFLQVQKINVCYWKEKVPGSYDVKERFPCFIHIESLESKDDIYGLPSNEYPGLMKVRHLTGPFCIHAFKFNLVLLVYSLHFFIPMLSLWSNTLLVCLLWANQPLVHCAFSLIYNTCLLPFSPVRGPSEILIQDSVCFIYIKTSVQVTRIAWILLIHQGLISK